MLGHPPWCNDGVYFIFAPPFYGLLTPKHVSLAGPNQIFKEYADRLLEHSQTNRERIRRLHVCFKSLEEETNEKCGGGKIGISCSTREFHLFGIPVRLWVKRSKNKQNKPWKTIKPRLRHVVLRWIKWVVSGDNLVRDSAGNTILNAELLYRKGLL